MPTEENSVPKTHSFRDIVAASVLASILSVAALWFVQAVLISPQPAYAQQGPSSTDVVLYASPRTEDGTDESFIFYNTKSGDLWVYRNQKIKRHYRVKELGIDLERIEVDRSDLSAN
jgi:hypothetical protein